VHTLLDKRAGFEDAGVVLERPLWACIGGVPEILRVIIPGLAQYHSAIFGKNIIINGLWFYERWILRKRNTAHAQYTNITRFMNSSTLYSS